MNSQTMSDLLPKAESGDALAQEVLAFAFIDQDEDNANAVKWLEEAEKGGHLSTRGAWIIGVSYDDGRGVQKDADKAEHYYRIAADSNEDNEYVNKACYWLANGHWAGDVVFGEDHEVAVHYLEKMLKNKTEKLQDGAKLDLAVLYALGDSPVYNPEKAEYYITEVQKTATDKSVLEQIDRAKSILAASKISRMAQDILNVASENEKNTRTERAEHGDPAAQYLLYAESSDDPQNEKYLVSSAYSGYLPAQVELAYILELRDGKHDEAFDLATKVWDNQEFQSDEMYKDMRPTIAYILGICNYKGNGTSKDTLNALKFFNIAADTDGNSPLIQRARILAAMIMLDKNSQAYNTGKAAIRAEQVLHSTDTDDRNTALRLLIAIYADPKSPEKNINKAIEYATIASEAENSEVKTMGDTILASMTKRKELLDRASREDPDALYALSEDDYYSDESATYLERAAKAGNVDAQIRIAFMYMLEDNERDCVKWALKAYNNGARNPFVLWKTGYAYATGKNIEYNPALSLKYLTECAAISVQSHNEWVDKARAFLMMELCHTNGEFGENTLDAVKYAESVYCDTESEFRNEALKVLILTYADIDCPAFNQQKTIMYVRMGLNSDDQEVRNAAQKVKGFYHDMAVRESIKRREALKNDTTYIPTEKEKIASTINQQLIHYQSNNESDNNSTEKSGGCYIATSVYGSYDCPEVWTLRRYRDNRLALSPLGRFFIKIYYKVSPWMVKHFGNYSIFQHSWKFFLDHLVARLQKQGYLSSPYQDK